MAFNPTDVRLLDDRILVRRVDRGESITQGGIHIPDQAQELGDCAEVVAVGSGARDEDGNRIPLDTVPGDLVVINRYAGTEITVGDTTYLVLRDRDVLAKVEEEVAA